MLKIKLGNCMNIFLIIYNLMYSWVDIVVAFNDVILMMRESNEIFDNVLFYQQPPFSKLPFFF